MRLHHFHHVILFFIIIVLLLVYFISISDLLYKKPKIAIPRANTITLQLPPPMFTSQTSVEEALKTRRSIRVYKNQSISLEEITQLLWAAQGITAKNGFRTAPSAGALYPLELYLVAGAVESLSPGLYHYLPATNSLVKLQNGDIRIALCNAALGQPSIKLGAADIVITAVFSRTTAKYGKKGISFVFMEAGHAAQNVYLQTVSLGLGTVSIGAFNEREVKQLLNITEEPLYIMPVGKI